MRKEWKAWIIVNLVSFIVIVSMVAYFIYEIDSATINDIEVSAMLDELRDRNNGSKFARR